MWRECDPGRQRGADFPIRKYCGLAARSGAAEDEGTDAFGMIQRQLLRDHAAHRRAKHAVRLAVGNIRTEERHVRRAFDLLRQAASARA